MDQVIGWNKAACSWIGRWRALAASAGVLGSAACAVPGITTNPPAPVVPAIEFEYSQPQALYSPIEITVVQAVRLDAIPAHVERIGRAEVPVSEGATPDSILLETVRSRAARRGGTMVIWRRLNPRVLEFTVVRDRVIASVSDLKLAARRDSLARGLGEYGAAPAGTTRATGTATGTGTTGGSSSRGCVGSCSVRVRGYTRKDGTYVRPHTRNAPGRGRSRGRRN